MAALAYRIPRAADSRCARRRRGLQWHSDRETLRLRPCWALAHDELRFVGFYQCGSKTKAVALGFASIGFASISAFNVCARWVAGPRKHDDGFRCQCAPTEWRAK